MGHERSWPITRLYQVLYNNSQLVGVAAHKPAGMDLCIPTDCDTIDKWAWLYV